MRKSGFSEAPHLRRRPAGLPGPPPCHRRSSRVARPGESLIRPDPACAGWPSWNRTVVLLRTWRGDERRELRRDVAEAGQVEVGSHSDQDQQAPAPEKLAPAVSVRRSIGRDHLVCLACGKKQGMLKRHLATRAQSYAERLPRDVPPQAGLSDRRPELCRGTARVGPENRSRAADEAHQPGGEGGAGQDPEHASQGCLEPGV